MGCIDDTSLVMVRMPVFLFNYSERKMYGIYRALSEGDLEINPTGEEPFIAVSQVLELAIHAQEIVMHV